MAKKRALEIRYKGKKLQVGAIADTIAQLPKNIRGAATEVIAKEFVKRFKKYPRYKYVSRGAAYPEVGGFFSEKQRRFVMAGIKSGRIQPGKPHRTKRLQEGWHIEGKNTPLQVVNSEPAAVFAFHPIYQARQLAMVGWKDIDTMTEENEKPVFEKLITWMNKELILEFDRILLKKKKG